MEVDKKIMTKKLIFILIKRIGKTTKPGQYRFSPGRDEKSFKKNYLIFISNE